MTSQPEVLIGLRPSVQRERLVGWVRGQGYETDVANDGREIVARASARRFAASFLDASLETPEGGTVWRVVLRIVGRRLVLMAHERTNDLWFEALRAGVGTVLLLPPEEATVHAALRAVAASDPFDLDRPERDSDPSDPYPGPHDRRRSRP
jgi:CheY-like chemotaxis protein